MRYTNKDAARQLTDTIKSDQRELIAERKTFDGLKPRWFKADKKCAESSAVLVAHDNVYTRLSEPLFKTSTEMLTREHESNLAERDSILGDVPQKIEALESRIASRFSCLWSPFLSFLSIIADQLPAASRASILNLRAQAEQISDPSTLIDFIAKNVSEIEELDTIQTLPMLHLDRAIAAALAVGQEQLVSVA